MQPTSQSANQPTIHSVSPSASHTPRNRLLWQKVTLGTEWKLPCDFPACPGEERKAAGVDEWDLPPLRSAEAPTYWKLSMLMTSMMGETTRVLSCGRSKERLRWDTKIQSVPLDYFPGGPQRLPTSRPLCHQNCSFKPKEAKKYFMGGHEVGGLSSQTNWETVHWIWIQHYWRTEIFS